VQQFFPELRHGDRVLEPSAGLGSFLHAIPADIEAVGVEIDPIAAAKAAADTNRRIIVGDFLTVDINFEPTHIIGNPPFASATILGFTKRSRALLPPAGIIGWILPAYIMSFAISTLELVRGFDVSVHMIPRDLYPRITHPLIFARLTKATETRLVGLALFEEALAVRGMRARYRKIVESGRKPIWRDVLETALHALGGEGTLQQVYRVVEGIVPTTSQFWKDILRREAGEHCDRVAPGRFRLRTTAAA
jgi:site-specific DNA-methyltransferase (adenine-specific)